MNEIADKLQQNNIPVSVPSILPEIDDIILVEEQLLIGLPYEFREFLMAVGNVVYGTIELVSIMDPASHNYLPEIASIAWDKGIPRDLVPICETTKGYYCIAEDGEISYWENLNPTEQVWSSIWDWAENIWLES